LLTWPAPTGVAAGNLAGKTTPTGQQWQYRWNAAGLLAEVVRPDGGVVRFTYDSLGRRVSKSYRDKTTRWVWDGNVPLHEWTELALNGTNTDDVITWLFEADNFAPLAKLTAAGSFSVVSDHLGTPLEMHDAQGQLHWSAELDSYGAVRQGRGAAQDCPFRYQGQYEDEETGLYYNRFRYYDPQSGQYISQDPIRLAGGMPMYSYVRDTTRAIDSLGLSGSILGQNLLKAGQTHGISPFNRTDDWQAHHLIPEEVWGQNKKFFKDIGVRGRDNARNGLFLPNSEALGNSHGFEYYHSGSHATYSGNVTRSIGRIETDLRSGRITKIEAKQRIESLQHSLRSSLNGRTAGTGCKRLS
jgi:RHS repeat-associated protein